MSLLSGLCGAIPAREQVITCEEVFELRRLSAEPVTSAVNDL
jgi:Flp pilus assembly CpaF family ATPase